MSTYTNFTIETDADGIALVTWDMPEKSMNVFTSEVMDELNAIVDATVADSDATARALVEDGTVDAAVVGDGQPPLGFSVIVESDVPSSLLMSLSQTPNVVVLDPANATKWIGYIAAIGFGVVFLFAAQTFGATIAQSVVEEKQTRVVELLISAIPARALLAESWRALGSVCAIADEDAARLHSLGVPKSVISGATLLAVRKKRDCSSFLLLIALLVKVVFSSRGP